MLEKLSHQVAGPEKARTHAGFGNAEDRGNLHAGEFLECRKHQNLAFLGGKAIDAG